METDQTYLELLKAVEGLDSGGIEQHSVTAILIAVTVTVILPVARRAIKKLIDAASADRERVLEEVKQCRSEQKEQADRILDAILEERRQR